MKNLAAALACIATCAVSTARAQGNIDFAGETDSGTDQATEVVRITRVSSPSTVFDNNQERSFTRDIAIVRLI